MEQLKTSHSAGTWKLGPSVYSHHCPVLHGKMDFADVFDLKARKLIEWTQSNPIGLVEAKSFLWLVAEEEVGETQSGSGTW
jgi:glutathionylspermidine synthase